MNAEVMQLTQQSLWIVLVLAGPPVVVAAVVGIVVAFIQAATQLQEQTFQYAMKFFAIVVTIFATASLMGSTLYTFSVQIFNDFPTITGL